MKKSVTGFQLKKTYFICIAIFSSHFFMSHVVLPTLQKADIYPFYSWDLFSFTPAVQDFYFMRVLLRDEHRLAPPQLVFQHRDLYRGRSPRLIPHQIVRLGWALLHSAEKEQILSLQTELEQNLFSDFRNVQYEIAVSQQPIRELLKSNQVSSFRTLGQFEYRRQENSQ